MIVFFIINRFGRKTTLVIGVIPISLAWILIGFANAVPYLYVARFMCGLTSGLCYTVIPMYIGEIASDKIRGGLTVMLTIIVKTGVLLVYFIGPLVTFSQLAFLGLIPPVVFLLTVSWLPETPYYLLGENRSDEAFKNLSKLRGHANVHEELDEMALSVKKSQENKAEFKELLQAGGNRKALIILVGLTSAQILCGSQVIIAYAQTIFNRVGTNFETSDISIILGIVQLITVAVAASIIDFVGRRPLLLISVGGTAICNAVVGVYFLLERLQIDIKQITWVPVLALMIFIICYNLGMSTVLFAVLGEIFPKNLRAKAGAVYAMTTSTYSFSVSKLFQVVSDGLGSDVTFFGFAMFGFIFFPFVWCVVPETKGKSLNLILEELNSIKKKSSQQKSSNINDLE